MLPLGDILAGAQCPVDGAVIVPEHGVVPRDDPLAAVCGEDRCLYILVRFSLVLHQLKKDPTAPFPFRRRDEPLDPGLAHGRIRRTAEDLGRPAVDEGDSPVPVEDDEEGSGDIQVLAEPVFFPPQTFFARF
ncbi:hypothetical protein DSECCO2_623510 [anaerobic digester metagenome]